MAMTNTAVVSRGNAYKINVTHIVRRPGWNPRYDFGDLQELAAQIKEHGVLLPLRVKRIDGDKFELIDGDRRLSSIEQSPELLARFTTEGVPVIVVDSKQDDVKSLVQMFISNEAKHFNPLEEADAFKRMRDAGMSMADISKATGRSAMTINAAFALLEAPAETQAAVKSGTVNADMGRKIAVATRGNKAKASELTKEAVAAGKDKVKRRAVVAKIEEAKVAKHAAKGKELKIKPLSADDLNKHGAKMAEQLAGFLKNLGMKDVDAFMVKVNGSDELATAYTKGALDALKLAAGIKLSLIVA